MHFINPSLNTSSHFVVVVVVVSVFCVCNSGVDIRFYVQNILSDREREKERERERERH